MKIRTTYDPKPIPDRSYDWTAIDDDTYDGADDSGERYMVGCGTTEAEAIEDLMRLKQERAEYFEDLHFADYEDRAVSAEWGLTFGLRMIVNRSFNYFQVTHVLPLSLELAITAAFSALALDVQVNGWGARNIWRIGK